MKILSIQILRGGAAWMIVVHHFMQQFYGLDSHTNIVGDFFAKYGSLGVDIFFVISGFIMGYILFSVDRGAREFITNRIIRIVPNYWFWTFVILIMGVFIKDLHTHHATLQSVLMSLFFIPHENPSPILGVYPTLTVGWTLNLEIFFYSLIAVALLLKIDKKSVLILVSVSLFLLPLLYKSFHIYFYEAVAGNIRLFEFACGLFLLYCWKFLPKIFASKKAFYFSLFILIIALVFSLKGLSFVVISALVVYWALQFEVFLSSSKNNLTDILVYFGEISFSIYLTHSIVIWIVFATIGSLDTTSKFLLAFSSIIFLTYLLSVFSHKIIEVKLSKYLRTKYVS